MSKQMNYNWHKENTQLRDLVNLKDICDNKDKDFGQEFKSKV